MLRYLRTTTLSVTLLSTGLSLAGSPYSANRPQSADTPVASSVAGVVPVKAEKVEEQVVIVRETGKPDRHCVLVSMKTLADGTKTYQVKATDNGETLMIDQKGAVTHADTGPPIKSAEELILVEGLEPPAPPMKTTPAPIVVESTSPELTLPRLKDRPVDPLLHPPSVDTLKTPATSKPKSDSPRTPRKGFMQSLFGLHLDVDGDSVCGICETAAPASMQVLEPPPPESKKAPGVATIEPPGRSVVADPVGMRPEMLLPSGVPQRLDPVAINASAMEQVDRNDPDWKKLAELKQMLVNGLRPTQRMTAAEEMVAIAPGRLQEVRSLLMTAAQEDPAGCVRAAAVHCLTKLRTRDQAFSQFLDVAQEDEDAEVRAVVAYALQKLPKK